ncbi:hypothetical protein [Algoriphagus sp. A40]|uniref:hypothetical protein n=1 Tax=Algoriphagus sp. A40 TaxID=1945863 RepID=UPI0009864CA7|nr:hypothetical protein [Algoriphagus sp. A40]OOG76167.1 hypothetical protein B0E43_08990 [Algoriphagus sp. A40]
MKITSIFFVALLYSGFSFQAFSQESIGLITVNTNQAKLTENEKIHSKTLKVLMKGDKLELLDILFPNGIGSTSRYKVRFGETEGFISSYFIDQTFELQGAESKIKELELKVFNEKEIERKRREDSLIEVGRNEARESLERMKINEEEEIRKNDSIASVMLKNAKMQGQISYQKSLNDRREKFHKKYGKEIGEKIAKQTIWIGMTEEMLLDSWGKPEDINQTVTKYSNRKQYVFGSGQYVYVENGKVDAWQK